jgi:4-hydroxythreonine-4-phosphate dehydrogenase
MYHDQVLGPYKALYGYDAINLTLGLKYLRLSPDHGVARDIAGQGKADAKSLISAINFLNKIND